MTASSNIGLVIGSFHQDACQTMRDVAVAEAGALGIEVGVECWVPGSMEKPLAVKRLLANPTIDGVVVLGIIERGETGHGRTMGQAVIQALIDLQLKMDKPVGVGILGPDILPEQIPPRLKPYARDAVRALATMLQAQRKGSAQ